MPKKLTGRGGPGRGQGAKPVDPQLKMVAFPARVPKWLDDWAKAQGYERSSLVVHAICTLYKLTPPQPKKEGKT